MQSDNTDSSPGRVSLLEIAKVFLIIGATGFGGGVAIIALIQDNCVMRRRWLPLDEFSHGVAFGQILGPFAVNASIFVGYRLRGVKGAITAAVAFLAPSVTLVIILSALYTRFHKVPSLQAALHGIGPVVVALIVAAAYQMGKSRIRSTESIILMLAAVVLMVFANLQVVFILLGTAAYGLIKLKFKNGGAANEDI